MESIINFLEQYWGYTLVGGVSLGTIITFTITQIKALIKDKVNGTKLEGASSKLEEAANTLIERDAAFAKERSDLETQLVKQQQEAQELAEYFEKVQAATFQAISYLVIASKLPTEDKVTLQEKFTELLTTKVSEYHETLKDEVSALQQEVNDKVLPDAIETVKNTVEETKSLLDRYKKEG